MAAKPYERQQNESDKAWAAFLTYRDMALEERSTIAVADKLHKSKELIQRWCSRHRWVTRTRAWDATVDRRKREADLRAVEKMRERQIALAMSLQSLGGMELKKLLHEAEKLNEGVLPAPEVLRFIEQGTKLERLNRGEPGEITQSKVDPADLDYTQLTTEELQQLRALRRKIVRKDGGD